MITLGLGVYQFLIPGKTGLLSLQKLRGGPPSSSYPPVASRGKHALGGEPAGLFGIRRGRPHWHSALQLNNSTRLLSGGKEPISIDSFIHSFHKYLLSTYCVPSPVLGTGDT